VGSENRLWFQRTSYSNIAKDLDQAVEWLTSVGISVSRTRVAQYARTMKSIEEMWSSGTLEQMLMQQGTLEVVDTLFEARELQVIHQSLAPLGRQSSKGA